MWACIGYGTTRGVIRPGSWAHGRSGTPVRIIKRSEATCDCQFAHEFQQKMPPKGPCSHDLCDSPFFITTSRAQSAPNPNFTNTNGGRDSCDSSFLKEEEIYFLPLRKRRVAQVARTCRALPQHAGVATHGSRPGYTQGGPRLGLSIEKGPFLCCFGRELSLLKLPKCTPKTPECKV